ncbi:class I SAM-dependent methyltransferase [Leptospira stimsonii]|uniref:Class I SAM-dependent methyltransferase n=1 Tax=Leptospira stimsonii TaxID=2202203 RepID=A0A396Z5X6_9LEPT|nr:methyltransferase domain-containing protein [Leptospira stimsonii]RHX90859.1 class I SAM-dependent methyltransferase [Leptospira stimsonii]
MKVEKRYLDGSYIKNNPNWDREDSPWKAEKVDSILKKFKIEPKSICEIGCGTGDTLAYLGNKYPFSKLVGYDVSPQLRSFWNSIVKNPSYRNRIKFYLGDFVSLNKRKHDVLLMLDVFEHVRDPFTFLENASKCAEFFVFHIPLDLSVISVLRNTPLMNVRHKVGHLHFYNKDLALETLIDSGFEILHWAYTRASLTSPNRSLKTKLMSIPRYLLYLINKDIGVRIFGGETLIVLAKAK